MKPLDDHRRELCERNRGLVKYVLGRWFRNIDGEMRRDLASHAYLALVEAASLYDESKGVQFNTYAIARIWGRCKSQLTMQMAGKRDYRAVVDFSLNGVASECPEPPELAAALELSESIADALADLPEKESHAIECQFGLFGRREMTQREYAASVGRCKKVAWEMRKFGLEKLTPLLSQYAEA